MRTTYEVWSLGHFGSFPLNEFSRKADAVTLFKRLKKKGRPVRLFVVRRSVMFGYDYKGKTA